MGNVNESVVTGMDGADYDIEYRPELVFDESTNTNKVKAWHAIYTEKAHEADLGLVWKEGREGWAAAGWPYLRLASRDDATRMLIHDMRLNAGTEDGRR